MSVLIEVAEAPLQGYKSNPSILNELSLVIETSFLCMKAA